MANVRFSYDHDSDTLMRHLYGRGRKAVSIEAGDNVYVRYDRANDQVVGVQFENVLQAIMPKYPELLDHADVFGIDSEGTHHDRHDVASLPRRRAALVSLEPLFGQRWVTANLL